MYLMYVDESGDPGMSSTSPSPYFVLTGLVVHELDWHKYLQQIVEFRRRMERKFGFYTSEELHAAPLMNARYHKLSPNNRLTIIREFADELASMSNLRLINIAVEKRKRPAGYDVFGMAWMLLIQRFENTLNKNNFPGPNSYVEKGMIFPDQTAQGKLKQLLHQMRCSNPIPNQFGRGARDIVLAHMVEEPIFTNSAGSQYIQAADVAAYLLYQHLAPNSYMRKKSGQNFFLRLEQVLCKVAAKDDPLGIVRL